jgi:DNA-binding MarR family transcriptional regulator
MVHAMSDDPLHHLMDALSDLRRFWERPDRKRRFLAELAEPVELGVLRTLNAVARCGEQEMGVGTVADMLAVDQSTASRLVEQAVRAGYLVREAGAQDRRRTPLALTDEGRALLDRATAIRRRWLAGITATWNPEEVEGLAALLRRFLDDAADAEDGAR